MWTPVPPIHRESSPSRCRAVLRRWPASWHGASTLLVRAVSTALLPIVAAATAMFVVGPSVAAVSASDPELPFTRLTDGAAVTDAASTGGVSWADYDDDGDPDLYVTNGYDVSSSEPSPQPNRLYRNDGGVLIPVADVPLVEVEGFSSGSTWGDYDGDGDLDVFVSNQRDQDNLLFDNLGDGRFRRVEDIPPTADGGWSYSSSWVDVDADGRLDLFVANGGLSHVGNNFLYRNLGDGRFERIEEGPVVEDLAATGAGVWADADADGDQDLAVATNMVAREGPLGNVYYRNDGDWRFTRFGDLLNPGDTPRIALAATWGDVDADGRLDLYVANQYGGANDLYRNLGDDHFEDDLEGDAVVDGGSSYSATWGDLDNDGDLDLVVVNWDAAPVVYANEGGRLVRADAGDLGRSVTFASSVALADYDGDGDLDVYVGNWPNRPGPGEPNHLYRNDDGAGHWLRVRLRGTESNSAGLGARIELRARIGGESRLQVREVAGATGWRSQNELVQHFGLGDVDVVDELVVRWPSGRIDRLSELAADRLVEVVEGHADRG